MGLHPAPHPPSLIQEARIGTPYDRPIDRALRTHKRLSRIVTGLILLAGLAVLGFVAVSSGWRRERAASRVMIGDDSVRVIRLLGEPQHRCPPSSLAHLSSRFEPGTPRPLMEQTLAQLRSRTVGRWVYPRGAGCVTGDGDTEIGIDHGGRVLWIVPATGRQPLRWEEA